MARRVGRDGSGDGKRLSLGSIIGAVVVAGLALYAMSGLFGGGPSGPPLRIVSGSENKALEPIIRDWARDQGRAVEMSYLGSVDIARELEKGQASAYDAVWPANALWIEYGDSARVVKHAESIMRSPVVLGLERSIAQKMGWVGQGAVPLDDIRRAAESGAFRLAMTSATQSNSGASAYFGFLHAISGAEDALTLEDLEKSDLRQALRDLLGSVDRSSGSSGWLKDAYLKSPEAFDAMINYEALIIEANQELVRRGEEPLHVVYPAEGMAVADSPLGYIDKGDSAEDQAKEETFLALKAHLLAPETQDSLIALGRRAGLLGLDVEGADRRVWNPDWGVDLGRAIAPIPTPRQAVISRALELYQTDLRKPSLTIWVLDVSGSMEGAPLAALKNAMRLLLDRESARRNLLSPSPRDVTIVIPFNNRVGARWRVDGDDPAALDGLMRKVERMRAGGGTDLYSALIEALRALDEFHQDGVLFDRLPAIVAMTDGESDRAAEGAFRRALQNAPYGRDVPVHAIAFGQADKQQLEALADASVGRLFDAKDDLAGALRKAKGYN